MSQQIRTQIASTFIYWICPLQNLLYIVYVFLVHAINNVLIMSVYYVHTATFLLTTLDLYRFMSIKWVSKYVKILYRCMSTSGSKKQGEVPRVFKFG